MTSKIYQEILSDGKLHHIVSVEGRVYVDGALCQDLDSQPLLVAVVMIQRSWFMGEDK